LYIYLQSKKQWAVVPWLGGSDDLKISSCTMPERCALNK
jgi:hypothetical protein